jgi:hypothetical protein
VGGAGICVSDRGERLYDELFDAFGASLAGAGPHELAGLRGPAWRQGDGSLHDFFCIRLDEQLGRPRGWPSPACWVGEITIHTKRSKNARSPAGLPELLRNLKKSGRTVLRY